MSTVGSITGTLTLQVGSQTVNLGAVVIPLTARNAPRQDSGSGEVMIEIAADLKQVRETVQALFLEEARA